LKSPNEFVVVLCNHCGMKIRVWIKTTDPILFQIIDCAGCKKVIELYQIGKAVKIERA